MDLEKGEAKIDAKDLVIVELRIDHIGPVSYREAIVPLENAETSIHFDPISEVQFNDSTLEYKDLILNAWAIDTMRQLEYFFIEYYRSWVETEMDTIPCSKGVSGPKYSHYIKN